MENKGKYQIKVRTKNGKTHVYDKTDDQVLNSLRWNIITRCYKPYSINYERYGGRGIKVCDEWINNSESFIYWAKANGWRRDLQIDRINNEGNYTPDNCRFVTASEQQHNKRRKRNSTNKYKCVMYHTGHKKWEYKFSYDKVKYAKGSFKTELECLEALNNLYLALGLHHKIQKP